MTLHCGARLFVCCRLGVGSGPEAAAAALRAASKAIDGNADAALRADAIALIALSDPGSRRAKFEQLMTATEPEKVQTERRRDSQRFTGNIIPSNRFDPVGARAVGFDPEPKLPGDPVTLANNYISNDNAISNAHNWGGRVDLLVQDR